MVLTRSGREVQKRLSVGSNAGPVAGGKKSQGSKRNKHVENEVGAPLETAPAAPTPRHWFIRMLLFPFAPFIVIWSLSGIFMMATGPVYPASHPVWGARGRCSQIARRALGIFFLVTAGAAYIGLQYVKAKRSGRFDEGWGTGSTTKEVV